MAFEVQVSAFLAKDERKRLKDKGPFVFYANNLTNDTDVSISTNTNTENIGQLKETSKKRQLQEIFNSQGIYGAIWSYSEDAKSFHVRFYVYGANKMDIIMEDLRFKGFGSHKGSSIHVVESTAYFCDTMKQNPGIENGSEDKSNLFQNFVNSVKSRMTVVQIYQNVKDRGQITFDYLCFLMTAAGIATISLSTNNYPGIVASMLLSPLLDPILAFLFGIILQQKQLITEGMKNLAISIAVTLIIGFMFGIVCHYINFLEKIDYPTSLMMDKAKYIYILSVLTFAIVSAPNLSTALLSNNSSAQIGNAISLSLLPPIVNTGFLWFLSLVSVFTKQYVNQNGTVTCTYNWLRKDHRMVYFEDFCKLQWDFLVGGLFSFFISISNITIIIVIGYYVFKFKKLASFHLLQDDARRFYDKDLKEAYTPATMKTLKAKDPNTVLLSEMIKEYAGIQNKNIDDLTKTEKNRLLGDLQDIAKEVTKDRHFQNIARNNGTGKIVSIPETLKSMEEPNEEPTAMINHLDTVTTKDRQKFMKRVVYVLPNQFSPSYRKSRREAKKDTMHKASSVGRFEVMTNIALTPKAVETTETTFSVTTTDIESKIGSKGGESKNNHEMFF